MQRFVEGNAADLVDSEKTNETVLREAQTGKTLLSLVKKRKLRYFGHVARKNTGLEKDIMVGMVEGERRRGRPRVSWINNMTAWTKMSILELNRKAQDRAAWRCITHTAAYYRFGDMG